MDRLANVSSSSTDENIQTITELNSRKFFLVFSIKFFFINLLKFSAEINSSDPLILKTNAVGFPLVAGLIGTGLQGHTMNVKENPLKKAGYDYGDTIRGTGEGWGYFSPVNKNKFNLKKNNDNYYCF